MRAFFAVYPDEAARAALADVAPDDDEELRATEMADWHVTLRFLGEVDEDATAFAIEAGERTARQGLVSSVRLGPATALGPGGHVLFVPADGIDALANALDEQLEGTFGPRDRPFRGHLTMGRARGQRRLSRWRAGSPVRATFPVDELVLVGSTLTPERAVHRVVARFPLLVGTSP